MLHVWWLTPIDSLMHCYKQKWEYEGINSIQAEFKVGPLGNPMHRLLKEDEGVVVLFSILCYGIEEVWLWWKFCQGPLRFRVKIRISVHWWQFWTEHLASQCGQVTKGSICRQEGRWKGQLLSRCQGEEWSASVHCPHEGFLSHSCPQTWPDLLNRMQLLF